MKRFPKGTGGAKAGTAAACALAITSVAVFAAPPIDVPFGVYDPAGDFSNDDGVIIEHLFLPWEDVALQSLVDADAYALARGRALLVTIEPWTWSVSERNTPEALRAGIRDGEYDANMRAICEVLDTLTSPVTVRWGHEMDHDRSDFIWSMWDPETYILAYRRMIDICRSAAPAINVMWSPIGDDMTRDYYPGDDYTDLVGLSVFGYQPYDRFVHGGDQFISDILAPRYQRALEFGKPIVIAELGFSGNADYVRAWQDSLAQIGAEFPELVGVVYFNYPEVNPWPFGFGLPNWSYNANVIELPDTPGQ